jgi:hypothetical protein
MVESYEEFIQSVHDIAHRRCSIVRGTFEQASQVAEEWLEAMQRGGIQDVALYATCYEPKDNVCGQGVGYWTFQFEHRVTGVVATLETHGLTPEEFRERIYPPKIYWNGSSSANPEVGDFLKDGYSVRIVKDENKGVTP